MIFMLIFLYLNGFDFYILKLCMSQSDEWWPLRFCKEKLLQSRTWIVCLTIITIAL